MNLLNGFRSCQSTKAQTGLTGQNGFAIIVVLSVLFLVTGVALLAFSTSDTDRKIAGNNLDNTQAYYSAEAGIAYAMANLSADTLWRAGFNNDTVGNASYSVQVIDSTIPGQSKLQDSLILHATGFADGAKSEIEVLLGRPRIKTFRYAAFGDTAFKFGGNGMTDSYNSDSGTYLGQRVNGPDDGGNMFGGSSGDVSSNGKLNIGGGTQIHGNASSYDTVIVTNSSRVYGTTNSNAPRIYLPPITQQELDYAKANSNVAKGMKLTGKATYDPKTYSLDVGGAASNATLGTGVYYFSDIKLGSGAQLTIAPGADVTIYMTGDLDATSGIIVNNTQKADHLQIYCAGANLSLSGGTGAYQAIYAPNANINISGGSDLWGAVIGKSLASIGGSKFHFDRALLKLDRTERDKYKRVAWHVL